LAFGDLNDPATIALIASVVILACAIVILGMRRRTRKPRKPAESETEPKLAGLPFKITKSIQGGDASHAKDELRILDLEREILSDAIRRLYEAHAEGKITEQERERLAGTYKARMGTVKDSIAKDETIVALHELEGMQEDLMKLFSERFGELSSKVEELRTRIDVKPLKEIKVQLPTQERAAEKKEKAATEEEEEETEEAEGEAGKPKKRKKAEPEKPRAKTEAEQRIEQIRGEVEKVLDKLGQMEIET
jgi:hypothetical protein